MLPMTKICTQNDVLRYIYGETTEEENLTIQKALLLDPSLMDFYRETLHLQRQISDLEIAPSKRCVDAIIEYAQSGSLQSID